MVSSAFAAQLFQLRSCPKHPILDIISNAGEVTFISPSNLDYYLEEHARVTDWSTKVRRPRYSVLIAPLSTDENSLLKHHFFIQIIATYKGSFYDCYQASNVITIVENNLFVPTVTQNPFYVPSLGFSQFMVEFPGFALSHASDFRTVKDFSVMGRGKLRSLIECVYDETSFPCPEASTVEEALVTFPIREQAEYPLSTRIDLSIGDLSFVYVRSTECMSVYSIVAYQQAGCPPGFNCSALCGCYPPPPPDYEWIDALCKSVPIPSTNSNFTLKCPEGYVYNPDLGICEDPLPPNCEDDPSREGCPPPEPPPTIQPPSDPPDYFCPWIKISYDIYYHGWEYRQSGSCWQRVPISTLEPAYNRSVTYFDNQIAGPISMKGKEVVQWCNQYYQYCGEYWLFENYGAYISLRYKRKDGSVANVDLAVEGGGFPNWSYTPDSSIEIRNIRYECLVPEPPRMGCWTVYILAVQTYISPEISSSLKPYTVKQKKIPILAIFSCPVGGTCPKPTTGFGDGISHPAWQYYLIYSANGFTEYWPLWSAFDFIKILRFDAVWKPDCTEGAPDVPPWFNIAPEDWGEVI